MKLAVVTTTRAEYGLLRPLIRKIEAEPETELALIVTGTHLLQAYGETVRYIEEDGVPIALRIPVDIDTRDSAAISQTMGRYFLAFSGVFERMKPDFLVVLGDRYELIPICFCAANAHVPIAHISGGEVTQGAIDDAVRHCVTKLSYLHFPACETYRRRIIRLGEDPARVFNVGDPGVENIRNMAFLPEKELRAALGLAEGLYFTVIFHPVTLDTLAPEEQVRRLLAALEQFPELQFVIVKANADSGGERINRCLESFAEGHTNCRLFSSLRTEEFLSLQHYSMGLIGNSSSGIVETPCFGLPTVNIGDRQKGRLFAKSILSCPVETEAIAGAIRTALTDGFREQAREAENPYGSGETSAMILAQIQKTVKAGPVDLKKAFYDGKVEAE